MLKKNTTNHVNYEHKKEEEIRGITDARFTKFLIQLDKKYPEGVACSNHPTFETLDVLLSSGKLLNKEKFLEFIGVKNLACECEVLDLLVDIGGYPHAFEDYLDKKYNEEE